MSCTSRRFSSAALRAQTARIIASPSLHQGCALLTAGSRILLLKWPSSDGAQISSKMATLALSKMIGSPTHGAVYVLGSVRGHIELQMVRVQARKSLDHGHLVAVRGPKMVEPGAVVVAVGFDDKRVAFPVADGVSIPGRIGILRKLRARRSRSCARCRDTACAAARGRAPESTQRAADSLPTDRADSPSARRSRRRHCPRPAAPLAGRSWAWWLQIWPCPTASSAADTYPTSSDRARTYP